MRARCLGALLGAMCMAAGLGQGFLLARIRIGCCHWRVRMGAESEGAPWCAATAGDPRPGGPNRGSQAKAAGSGGILGDHLFCGEWCSPQDAAEKVGSVPGDSGGRAIHASSQQGTPAGKPRLSAWAQSADWRNVRTGNVIPDEGYCDQPYVVVTQDGHWLCTLTTGPGREGEKGQHVVSTRSADRGKTWSALVAIEPASGPEASWVVPLVTPAGRVYAFYSYNGERIGTLGNRRIRADTLGWYVFKFSDDHGRTWSRTRYRLPMRVTECDRHNDWQGRVQMFWGIDKPKIVGREVFFAFTKLARYPLSGGEGWIYRSDNLLEECDPARVRWQMLPEGDRGLRNPQFGSVQEEHNLVPLSDGSLYCVYRTAMGFPCHAYSRDGGKTWTRPEPMTYTPGGRVIKNPRACPKLWRTFEGRYLLWFHNHGGKSFEGRNPAWVAGGIEREGSIHWSQPEILLYDPDPQVRISYPDLLEEQGRFWVTETQKSIARVHAIDAALLEGLWTQGQRRQVSREGLVAEAGAGQLAAGSVAMPTSLDLSRTGGATVELWAEPAVFGKPGSVLEWRGGGDRGLKLSVQPTGAVRVELSDGRHRVAWDSDPVDRTGRGPRHVTVVIDAGPQVILFLVDGTLCDGGHTRPQGWFRYGPALGEIGGEGVRLNQRSGVLSLRVYRRALRVSEVVASYLAGSGG